MTIGNGLWKKYSYQLSLGYLACGGVRDLKKRKENEIS